MWISFSLSENVFFFSTSPFLDILSLDVSGGVQNSKPRTRPGRNVQTPWKPSYEDSWPFGPDLLQLGLDFIELGLTSSRCQKGPPMGRKNPPGLPKKGPAFEGKAIILHYHSLGMVHIYLTWRVDFYGKFWEIYHIWRLWEWLKVALIIMFGYFLGGYARGVGWVAIYTTGENDVWVSFAHCKPKKYGMLDLWIFDWLSTLRKHGEVTVTLFDIPE